MKNLEETNSALESYYQVRDLGNWLGCKAKGLSQAPFARPPRAAPQVSEYNTELAALVSLVDQLISEKAFNTLRTKEQLGYTVHFGQRLTHGILGFCMVRLGAVNSSRVHSVFACADLKVPRGATAGGGQCHPRAGRSGRACGGLLRGVPNNPQGEPHRLHGGVGVTLGGVCLGAVRPVPATGLVLPGQVLPNKQGTQGARSDAEPRRAGKYLNCLDLLQYFSCRKSPSWV